MNDNTDPPPLPPTPPPEDLRHNPDLDAIFGMMSNGTPAKEAVDAAAARDASQNVYSQAGKEAGKAAEAAKNVGNGPNNPPPDPPKPPGNGPNDSPTVNISDESMNRLADTIAAAIVRTSTGTGTDEDLRKIQNKPQGAEQNWFGRQVSRIFGDQRNLGDTRHVSEQKGGNREPGEAGKITGKAGEWLGKAVGAAIGSRAGPAGANAGSQVGGEIGKKAGSAVGAPFDKAAGIIQSGNASGSLRRMMPDEVQPIIRWYMELNRSTAAMMEHNAAIGQYSAAMNNVMGEREQTEAFRSKEVGDRVSGSARGLMQAEQERKDGAKEIGVLSQRIDNGVQEVLNRFAGLLQLPFEKIATWINKQLGDDEADNAMSPTEFMDSISKQADRKYAEADARLARLADEQRAMNRGRAPFN